MTINNNKAFRVLIYPLVWMKRLITRNLSRYYPKSFTKYAYKKYIGDKLDIDNPKNLYEKINFIRFYGDTALWSDLTDKYKVRDYVSKCGYANILNELYGHYYKVSDIDFSELPEKFVLKTNNACETNLVVKDKNTINYDEIRKKLYKWLKDDYGRRSGQPHYSKIEPCIIAERYIENDNMSSTSLIDYKFYCFHGKVHYIFVYSDRILNTHKVKKMIYTREWEKLIHKMDPIHDFIEYEVRPESLQYMIEIAEKLSEPFQFVRVDLYEVGAKPIFGEMTFTPGYDSGANKSFFLEMGSLINI